MKTLFINGILALILVSACSTAETTIDDEISIPDEEAEVTEDVNHPEWYDFNKRAYADSAAFNGVGLAASTNSDDAREKAIQQAVSNLRFAIDHYVEEVRVDHANTSDFDTTSFILDLRNAVQDFPIRGDMDVTEETFETDDSVYQVYILITLDRDIAMDGLSTTLGNSAFSAVLSDQSIQ